MHTYVLSDGCILLRPVLSDESEVYHKFPKVAPHKLNYHLSY